MKVIIASYAKCGTTSLGVALQELGYKVYDFMDHFWYHQNEWDKVLTRGGTIEDFKNMYENVDAITDSPAYVFWEEVLQAFPDAKVILTTRNEDEWYKSIADHGQVLRKNFIYKLMQILSPTGWKYFNFYRNTIMILFGQRMKNQFDFDYDLNEMILRRCFRQHTGYCLQNCPREKLLVYNIKEGWKPLCEFLEEKVPDKEFPHENIKGNALKQLMKIHPATIRMQREMLVSLGLILGLGVFGSYKIYKSSLFHKLVDILTLIKLL